MRNKSQDVSVPALSTGVLLIEKGKKGREESGRAEKEGERGG